MDITKAKRQLIFGFLFFGLFIISGSIQVILSPFSFVRGVSIVGIIISSASIGAFIREWFILKEKNQVTK